MGRHLKVEKEETNRRREEEWQDKGRAGQERPQKNEERNKEKDGIEGQSKSWTKDIRKANCKTQKREKHKEKSKN